MHSLGALLVALSLAGCVRMPTWFAPTFGGQVVEQASGQPIAGAIVVGLWEEERSAYVHSRIHCIRAESATTDAQGNYTLLRPGGDLPNQLYVYKPGYFYFATVHLLAPIPLLPAPVGLRPFSGTKEERLNDLLQLDANTTCGSAGETGSEPNLLSLRRAMYGEARNIAQTKEDQKAVDHLLYKVEKIELGSRSAQDRNNAREEARRSR